MAQNTLGMNMSLPIYKGDGTSFNGLELKNFTVESVIMSLSDKITGYVMYNDNALGITMDEYVEYKRNPSDENEDAVRFVLVNPPTIVREGTVADNLTNKGATKYSFTFYHPMYMLSNMPFTDVAVNSSQELYLSQNNRFSWIGNLNDYVNKLNKNLQGTEWVVVIHGSVPQQDITKKSEVLSFDGSSIAEAIKKGYEEWKVPYVVDTVEKNSVLWRQGKRFVVQYGLPTQEIIAYDTNGEPTGVPFVFRFGQGVGLKNNSRTPRNNKIITRIAGYGSEDNIQYGYPHIPYEGGECAYPLYYGVVNGQRTQLIKHPFTRNHLMPSIYRETVNKKVNPMADGYNPNIEIKDYYDADNTYPNSIKPSEPSYELHEFEVKPELGEKALVGVRPYETEKTRSGYMTKSSFLGSVLDRATATDVETERNQMLALYNSINANTPYNSQGQDEKYSYQCTTNTHYGESGSLYADIDYMSSNFNFSATIELVASQNEPSWDDSIDDNGNYVQSYFEITIPRLQFDLYACAAATQEMSVNMRSGDCLGCKFQVQVDWDDYKRNFYDENGNFSPNGSQRDLNKYPNSSLSQITLILQKETTTFGTLMPNIYQNPNVGDKFVFLGISLPQSYVLEAESRLDDEMMEYMRENNVYYFDYPLKFSEHFLASHTNILWQMKPNVVVRFQFADETLALYVRQMTVKYNNTALPSYDITLTDDVEIVLNSIGEVEKEVSNLRVLIGQQGEQDDKNKYLRKDRDDTAFGTIRHTKGIQIGGRFTTGLLGEGGVFRKEEDGTTYLETDKLYVRMKLYSDSVEVKKYLHSGGNRSASKGGGVVCSRVEYIGANGDVTTNPNNAALYRCYFKASDNDKKVTNDFVVGDMAFCRETNIDAGNLGQHGYWRLVVGRNQSGSLTSNNEAWIDLSNRVSETIVVGGHTYVHSGYMNGSDVPIAQDDIIQLGNIYDKDRQGAIIEFVSGADSPSYQIFQGIDDFSLNNKNFISIGYSTQAGRAYMNVFGDAYIGDPNGSTYLEYKQVGQGGVPEFNIKANVMFESPVTHTDTTLADFANSVVGGMESLQDQIDGSIETWFYDYMPVEEDEGAPANTTPLVTRTVSGQKVPVYPYYDWFIADGGDPTTTPVTQPTSTTERLKHLGDTFYDNTSGYAFRFSNTGTAQSPTFAWVVIQDSAVIKALADAAKAQDTADNKRRAFVLPITIGSTTYNYPYPPYDVGDLWLNAKYPYNYDGATDVENDKYNNDVLRCITPQGENGSFSIDHWVLASKYTDDTEVKRIIESYGGILGVTADSEDVGEALGFLREVLGGKTSVDGGLILSELIAVKNGNQVMSGINGKIKASTGLLTPAAWYGGEMVDKDTLTDTQIADEGWNVHHWARALFRFDGSGYMADGNLAWNAAGEITKLAGQDVEVRTLLIGGSSAATQNWVSQNFVTIEFFERLFMAYFGNNTVSTNAPSSTQIDNIEARYSLWSNGDLTCLGHGSGGGGGSTTALSDLVDVLLTSPTSGQALVYNGTKWVNQTISGGGGADMATVWSALNAATNEQINASHLTNALSGYATTSALTGYLPLSAGSSKPLTGTLYFYGGANSTTEYGMIVRTNRNVSTSGGWTFRPIIIKGADNSDIFSLGLFGSADTLSYCYIGTGAYNATNNLRIYSDGVKWGTNTIYHAGNVGELFTALASSNTTNLTITIGGTTKTLTDVYAYQSKNVRPLSMAAGDDYDTLSGYTYTRGCFVAMNYSNLTTNDVTLADLGAYDTLVSFGYNLRTIQFKGNAYGTMRLKYRRVYQPSSGVYAFSEWKEIAFADGNIATATALATARTLWGQSFDGTSNVSGSMTGVGAFTQSGAINMQGSTASYCQGIRLHPANGTSSIFFGCDVDSGMTAGMFGITHNTTGLRIRGQASTTSTSLVDYLTVAYGGNVGIGTSSPSYLLHVNGQAAAQTFRSTVETGTAPLVVASSTLVTNLNADRLDGYHASDFAMAADVTTLQGYFDSSGAALSAVQLKTTRTLWGQNFNGTANVTGDMTSVGSITLTNNSRISNATGSGGSLYIGRADDAGWVKMSDMCSRQGDSYWKIKSNGDITAANVYSNGALTCLTGSSTSDARKKMIVGQVDLSVESIAKMPTVKFLWKHIPDKTVQVGTLAQSWQNVLPEAVTENDGVLGFQYGVAALLSAIVTARKVVNHERRIAQLEKENIELRNELNKIKAV